MASKSSKVAALLYETETNHGEVVTTTATRIRPYGDVTYDFQHEGSKPDILKQYPNEGVAYVRGTQGGSFGFTHPLTGLGSTAAGAAPASALATLLGTVFGATTTGLATGDTATGGTAAVPTMTGATGATAGGLVRIGVKGDGRGDGQWVAVGSHSSNNLTLLTAAPAAPSNGDVVYASRMVYDSQGSSASTLSSTRWRFQTAQQQYLVHGCYPTSATLNVEVGATPTVALNYGVSRWTTTNDTFPSAVSVQDHSPAPVAGGSLFINTVGTVTRNTLAARSVSVNVTLNNQSEMGVGGFSEHQGIVGCNRGPASYMVEFVVDSEAAGTDTYGALFDVSENGRLFQHALYSMSVGDGRAVAIYFPRLTQIGRPTQFDDGGVLRKRLRFEALTGGTTTSDLTLSPMRIALG